MAAKDWVGAKPATREMTDADLLPDIDGWTLVQEDPDLPNLAIYGKGDAQIRVMVAQPVAPENIDLLWDDLELIVDNTGICGTVDDALHCALNTPEFGEVTVASNTLPSRDGKMPSPATEEDIRTVATALGESWASPAGG